MLLGEFSYNSAMSTLPFIVPKENCENGYALDLSKFHIFNGICDDCLSFYINFWLRMAFESTIDQLRLPSTYIELV